jgi:hypothetical protein
LKKALFFHEKTAYLQAIWNLLGRLKIFINFMRFFVDLGWSRLYTIKAPKIFFGVLSWNLVFEN